MILCICFMQIFAFQLNAQNEKNKCDKQECQTMMKLKRDYVEKNFKVNESSSQAFWSAYQKMETAVFNAYSNQRKVKLEAGIPKHVSRDSVQFLTDEQIKIYYNINFETKRKVLDAEVAFFNEISNCLNAKEIAQYYSVEKNFKRSAVRKNASCKSQDSK